MKSLSSGRSFSVVALVAFTSVPAIAQVECLSVTNASYQASGGPVTDGGRIHLRATQPVGFAPILEGAHYVLSGYRYNDAPPSTGLPNGQGKERIHRSCHRIGPPVNASGTVYELPIGRALPSGDYFLGVLRDCPADLEVEICEATHRFMVAPSYMVTTLERLNVVGNSEELGDHPAELKFQFAAYSGKPFISGQASTSKVMLSGGYPGGPLRAGHLTHGDGTFMEPHLPVFVGRQSQMFSEECEEEARALPAGVATQSAARCATDEGQGRFSDHFEFAVSGAELDSSSSKVWAALAGAGAVGLSCLLKVQAGATADALGTCLGGATTLGTSVSALVEKALTDDDDNLGNVSLAFQLEPNLTWPTSGQEGFGPHEFTAGGSGSFSASFRNEEVGGLRLLDYRVELEEIEIIEGYELFSGCRESQEIFAIARAYAFDATDYPAATRHPAGSEVFSLPITFDIAPLIASNSFTSAEAPESPALYVEIGVWESDGSDRDGDLIGLLSETHHWQDLFARSGTAHQEFDTISHVDGTTQQGLPTRHIQATRTVQVRGFAGSDNHCFRNTQTDTQLLLSMDRNGPQGRADVTYRIEATWLRSLLR